MKRLIFLAVMFLPLSAMADMSDNPFLKPEVRNPPKPLAEQSVNPQFQVMNIPEIEPDEVTEEVKIQAPVEGTLIAVINGEEIWFKKEDKTYIHQEARDDSNILLQERNSKTDAEINSEPASSELPRASTERTTPARTR